MKTKAKGMGYGGVSTCINSDVNDSPVRVKATIDFIVKVDADQMWILKQYSMWRLLKRLVKHAKLK